MPFTRKQWQIMGTACFLLLFAWVMVIGKGDDIANTIAEAIGDAGWLPFFAAMTLLPLAGFPVTPFYLIGGAIFDEWLCMLGTALSLLVNLSLAYLMAARWMRSALQKMISRHGHGLMPAFSSRRHTWLYILTVRVTPGPPLSVKNYLAGLAGVPFVPYLIISWPIAMSYAAGLILLGDSLTEQRWFGVIAGTLVLGTFLAVMFVLRSWLQTRIGGLRRQTEPPPPVQD